MRGLRTAHRHAVVHRDIKPDNILVGEDGRVKLMDFGIAKTMAPSLTGAGEFLGSPAYSAPELLRGSDPTPSSDRYAFAVTAFELLTGLLPHPGANVAAVIGHILLEQPVIPVGMPGEVARVFRQAMAADPEDRPSSLMEFLVALVDAYPMEPLAAQRINELFRHDDHAGDIVPLRRPRALGPGQEAPAQAPPLGAGRDSGPIRDSGGQVRSSAGRSSSGHTVPAYRAQPQPPTIKIELQDHPPPERPSQARRPAVKEETDLHRTAVKLLKWFVVVLVAGQIFLWVYKYVLSTQAQQQELDHPAGN
jgi:serine/threonine protein kinase